MEGMELLATGAWSIVPPLLALGLALITKEVYSSLTAGVLSGLLIYEFVLDGVSVDSVVSAFCLLPAMFADKIAENAALILFLALLGALTMLITVAGGSRAYAAWVSQHIKSARMDAACCVSSPQNGNHIIVNLVLNHNSSSFISATFGSYCHRFPICSFGEWLFG